MSTRTRLGRIGLVPDGEYSAARTYKRLSCVSYEGGSYVCLKDDIQGVPPTPENVVPAEGAVWFMLAARGDAGEDGKPGMPGKDGKDGKSYVILGPVYSTEDALRQAVTAPNEGDRYEVGTQPPYNVYRWTGSDWVNEGPLSGGGGGADLSDETPKPLGEASPGDSDKAARADHVHEMPSADDVGALHPDPDDEGEMGEPLPINADLLEGKSLDEIHVEMDEAKREAVDLARLTNLLDNSNFREFYAQAGVGGNHGSQAYAGDRWILESGTVTGQYLGDNTYTRRFSMIVLNGTIRQKIENPPEKATAFVKMISGEAVARYENGEMTIAGSGVLDWAALYEGELDEAPRYVQKAHTVERAQCRFYYQRIGGENSLTIHYGNGFGNTPTLANFTAPCDPMRLAYPTARFGGTIYLTDRVSSHQIQATSVTINVMQDNVVYFNAVGSNIINGNPYTLRLENGGFIEFDADL